MASGGWVKQTCASPQTPIERRPTRDDAAVHLLDGICKETKMP